MVLFAFALSATVEGRDNFGQKGSTDKSGVNYSVVFPASKQVIRRKESIAKIPTEQSDKSGFDENTRLISNVFAPQLFSYTVVQQPKSNPYYVSSSKDLVTEFGLARKYGNIGLMAHNNLAGNGFEDLDIGQEIQISYKDGHTDRYTVSAIYRFRALEPTNTDSRFVDLDSQKELSASELFKQMYTGEPHVTFQTCITASGDNSWGRFFVIAIPLAEPE